jgi:drug/metabolite transporter (DMT)-like permease
MKERVGPRIWVALIFSLAGLTLVVQLWQGFSLDTLGTVAALGAAVAFALYILLAGTRSGCEIPSRSWPRVRSHGGRSPSGSSTIKSGSTGR